MSGWSILVAGYAHVRLTVTDIARSRAFYDNVFGFEIALEVPDGADAKTREQLRFLFGGHRRRISAGVPRSQQHRAGALHAGPVTP